jgi:nucleoside-diphosphate kinase
MERTFVMVKPLGLQNFLLEVLAALKGIGTIRARRLVPVTCALVEAHYAEHVTKPWFGGLVKYYQNQTVMALVVEGDDVIARVRGILGPSDPRKAHPSQLRHLPLTKWGDGQNGWAKLELCTSGVDNLVHASDSPDAAAREIALWFGTP